MKKRKKKQTLSVLISFAMIFTFTDCFTANASMTVSDNNETVYMSNDTGIDFIRNTSDCESMDLKSPISDSDHIPVNISKSDMYTCDKISDSQSQTIAQIGSTCYEDLSSALTAAKENTGCTLTLLDDITVSQGTSINGEFTFDLGGNTINLSEAFYFGDDTNVPTNILLKNGQIKENNCCCNLNSGTLTLGSNLTINGWNNDSSGAGGTGFDVKNVSTLIVDGATVKGGNYSGTSSGCGGNGITLEYGTLVLKSGSVCGGNTSQNYIINENYGGNALYSTNNDAKMLIGNVTLTPGQTTDGIIADTTTSKSKVAYQISGIELTNNEKAIIKFDNQFYGITGNKIYINNFCYVRDNDGVIYPVENNTIFMPKKTLTVTTHKFDPATNKCTICGTDAIAKIDTDYYDNIQTASVAAEKKPGCTLTLLNDISIDSSMNIEGNFTFDLDGHIISANSTICFDDGYEKTHILLKNGQINGNIMVRHATVTAGKDLTVTGGFNFRIDSSLCTFILDYGGTLIVDGATIKGGNYIGNGSGNGENAITVISGTVVLKRGTVYGGNANQNSANGYGHGGNAVCSDGFYSRVMIGNITLIPGKSTNNVPSIALICKCITGYQIDGISPVADDIDIFRYEDGFYAKKNTLVKLPDRMCCVQDKNGVNYPVQNKKFTMPANTVTVFTEHIDTDNDGLCDHCHINIVQPKLNNNGTKDTSDDYYEIDNSQQLCWLCDYVNAGNPTVNAKLTSNIIINENLMERLTIDKTNGKAAVNDENKLLEWNPIGSYNKSTNASTPFRGTFDGQGFSISGLYYNSKNSDCIGLFGMLSGATVQNVNLVDCYFGGSSYSGGICGYACSSSQLKNCSFTGTISSPEMYSGGICGYSESCNIEKCYNAGAIYSGVNVGGICGFNNAGSLTNCYNTGNLTVLTDTTFLGGVCGKNKNGKIEQCYNTGIVAGTKNISGICGLNENGTLKNNYYVSDTEIGTDITGQTIKISLTQLQSGELCYLLNGSQSVNPVWYQTCGKGIPSFSGDTVYLFSDASYTNEPCVRSVSGCSVSLAGNIGLNFYMELYSDVIATEGAYMEFRLPNGDIKQIPLSQTTTTIIDNKTFYKFSCEVAAKEMTKAVTAQIHAGALKSKVYSYSVKEYADYLLAHTEDNTEFAAYEDVVHTMLNYGSCAQFYFDYNTEHLANAGLDDIFYWGVSINKYIPVITGDLPDGVTYYGSSLLLKSTVVIRHYFSATNPENLPDGYTEKNGYYYYESEPVTVMQFGTPQTLTIGSWSISFSVISYTYKGQSNHNLPVQFQNLLSSISKYYYAAINIKK